MKDLYSQRIKKNPQIIQNRFQELMKMKKSYQGTLLDFGIGEDNSLVSEELITDFKVLINKAESYRYNDNGKEENYQLIKDYLYQGFGINSDLFSYKFTHGIKESLILLALLLVSKGDYVIVTEPGYVVFEKMVSYLGGKVIRLPLKKENNFLPQLKSVPKRILKKAKVILINYPNNPTGALASDSFYQELMDLGTTYNIWIINDHAYADFFQTLKPTSLLISHGADLRGIELYSASKSLGLTGLRAGFIVGPLQLMEKIKLFSDELNSGIFEASESLIATHLLKNLKKRDEINQNYKKKGRLLNDMLVKHGFLETKLQGAFYLYYKAPRFINRREFSSAFELSSYLLKRRGIVTIPYDIQGHFLRFSLTFKESEAQLEEELKRRLEGLRFKY